MEVYFFMLAVPSTLAVLFGKRTSSFLTISFFLLFVFLIGFRFNVGMDWNNYESIHKYIGLQSPIEILKGPEPLSTLIFWFSAYFNSGSLLSNVVAAGMLMFGVLSFARRAPNPWLAVVAATPYLIIAFGMSGIRQAMAVGVLLYAMSEWEESGTIRRMASILFASLFHASAAMAILFVLWDMRIRLVQKIGITALIAPVLFYAYQQIDSYAENVQFYQDVYLPGAGAVVSPGALYHIALVGLPAGLYFVLKKRFSKHLNSERLVFMGAWAVVAVFFLYFVSSTGASRLSAYLYFVPMVVYSSLPQLFVGKQRATLLLGIVGIHFLILAAWLVYANNSFAHIPYRNVIAEERVSILK